MTDYTQLNDFEVNKRIADSMGWYSYDYPVNKSGVMVEGIEEDTAFDWRNSWNDAGKLIIDNDISLQVDNFTAEKEYEAYANSGNHPICETLDPNPCKAIAICFLKIMESKE